MVLDDLDANARRAQYQNVPLVAMGEKSEVPQPSATPAPQQEVETTPPSKVKANSKEIPTPPDHSHLLGDELKPEQVLTWRHENRVLSMFAINIYITYHL